MRSRASASRREHGHGQDPRAAPHNLSILPTWASDASHGYSLAIIKANATLRTGLRFRYHPPTEAGTLTPGNLLEGVAGRAQGAYGQSGGRPRRCPFCFLVEGSRRKRTTLNLAEVTSHLV